MIQDIDEINVVLSDTGSIDVSIDNDNSISVNEGTPTDIAQIMHNEQIRQENETQRIANEEQRIANEEDREEYIADLKQRVLDGEFNGEDGYSPIATVVKENTTATITITDKNGTTTAQISDGQNGTNGEDGYSPIANVSKSGDTATITITDKTGTTTATVSDGTDGVDGTDGEDGYSPTATVSKSGKVATITITDKNGTTTTEIRDGEDGQGSGDMLKSTYDTDNNGIVDNAEKVNNHTVLTDVPADAAFTDFVPYYTYLNKGEKNNPVMLNELEPGTYFVHPGGTSCSFRLTNELTVYSYDTGGNFILTIPQEIDVSTLSDDDVIAIIKTFYYENSFKASEHYVYLKYNENNSNHHLKTENESIDINNVVDTINNQTIGGAKKFSDGIEVDKNFTVKNANNNDIIKYDSTQGEYIDIYKDTIFYNGVNIDSTVNNSVFNTWGAIQFNDANDGGIFTYNGDVGDPAVWNTEVQFTGGATSSVTPSNQYDLTNKSYVDTGLSGKQATIDSSHKLDADLVDDTTSTNKFFSGNYNDLSNKPTIPDELADLSDDATHRLVTDTEKTTWSGKQDTIDSSNKLSADLVDDTSTTNKFFSGDYNDLTNKPTIPDISTKVSKTGDTMSGNLSITGNMSSTSFEGKTWDFNTENTSDTWIPVASSNGKWQHRVIPVTEYSTSEINTYTKWIDGKWIYRKVFSKTSISDFSTGVTNISAMVDMRCMIKQTSTGDWRNLPWLFVDNNNYGGASWAGGFFYKKSNGYICFQMGNDLKTISQAYIIIEYTKS